MQRTEEVRGPSSCVAAAAAANYIHLYGLGDERKVLGSLTFRLLQVVWWLRSIAALLGIRNVVPVVEGLGTVLVSSITAAVSVVDGHSRLF